MSFDPTWFQRSRYHFDLPAELIATEALKKRDDSRLLVVDRSTRTLRHQRFSDLPKLIDQNTHIVVNNTSVFRARLKGNRILGLGNELGGKVEFFLLKKIAPLTWQGLIRSSARVEAGFAFQVSDSIASNTIRAKVIDRQESSAGVVFTAVFETDPVEAELGEVPLPPYILAHRTTPIDAQSELKTYNTVFATPVNGSGSVAAPTAGRHFTQELMSDLQKQGVAWSEVTLHVGLGTFKPVSTDDVRDHSMHGEWAEIPGSVSKEVNQSKTNGQKILAVGTTSARTLEGFSASGALQAGVKEVDLFIHPGSGHQWKMVDALVTNFHLPESTLLMMIADFIGDPEWTLQIYQAAIDKRYRFYSYGDAMLIL